MNINAPKGTKVKFLGQDKFQRAWGSHDEADGVLEIGKIYTINRTEIHSQHTKVELEEALGKVFNSVCFEQI